RRHTRCYRDWSSDVCSSDLVFRELGRRETILPMSWNLFGKCYQRLGRRELQILQDPFRVLARSTARPDLRGENPIAELLRLLFRSEERRVVECGVVRLGWDC